MTSRTQAASAVLEHAHYDALCASVRQRFDASTGPLFATDCEGLFDVYLTGLAEDIRKTHDCDRCRQFVERHGRLVTIDERGATHTVMWSPTDAPDAYREATRAMQVRVEAAEITGVFLSSAPMWGTAETGDWQHLHVVPSATRIHRRVLLADHQAIAEKREDFRRVCDALERFPKVVFAQAVALLESDAMFRSEKVLGAAQWALALQKARAKAQTPKLRSAVTWRAVATAPAGFAHIRASMIGTLLEDIAAGLPVGVISSKFRAKMDPRQYQRPQAAPTAGNIAQAEKVVAELGLASALRRRFARIDEVCALWRPVIEEQRGQRGVFGHLTPKGTTKSTRMELPSVTMTWVKFRDTVLPHAEMLELVTPQHGNYGALVTAVEPDARPILQWDDEARRNPVSWYVYTSGSSALSWGLRANNHVRVTAITLQPSMWGLDDRALMQHQGASILLLLEGARDSRAASLSLFPEMLKRELHGIRATIEAYSKAGKLEGSENATACGYKLEKGKPWDIEVRVTTSATRTTYLLDRWD